MAKSSVYTLKQDGKKWVVMKGNKVISFHTKKTAGRKKIISEIRKELSGK